MQINLYNPICILQEEDINLQITELYFFLFNRCFQKIKKEKTFEKKFPEYFFSF
jgi:hypothetical protein